MTTASLRATRKATDHAGATAIGANKGVDKVVVYNMKGVRHIIYAQLYTKLQKKSEFIWYE